MLRLILCLFSAVAIVQAMATAVPCADATCLLAPPEPIRTAVSNQCTTFTVSAGTGCAWMCGYCAAALGPNYYFTDSVCTYSTGGCVGNPIAGKSYTCCSA